MPRDSVKHTFLVAGLLCLVCSLLVSASAVGLRSFQQQNKLRDKQKNILIAAGLFDPNQHDNDDVDELFQNVEARIVDLEEARFLEPSEYHGQIDPEKYDQALAANDPEISYTLSASDDIASIQRRERYSYAYLVQEGDEIQQMILPVRGYGLWSTLWGFVAIDFQSLKQGPENITISGLKYYQHQETPGLGGEVDNPGWLAQWPGTHIYDANWNVKFDVSKQARTEYEIDALSGATITSNGVEYMMQFWFGPNGFRPFLQNLSQQMNNSVSQK